jgi:enoyl-CoA hydratase/carnithine racemase
MFLPWVVGMRAAKELLYTGEDRVPAAEAHRLGLVNRVVPADELDGAVAGLAAQITANAPLSVRAMKAFVQRASKVLRSLPRDDLEEMHRSIRASHDLQEGLAAQREKRAPKFTGR